MSETIDETINRKGTFDQIRNKLFNRIFVFSFSVFVLVANCGFDSEEIFKSQCDRTNLDELMSQCQWLVGIS